jgi:N4-gp56 family major capsid protein
MGSVLNTAVTTGPGFNQLASATRDVFSAEIWFAAMPVLKFDQFSTKKTELGVQPGRTIQMPKMGNVKRGGQLTEGVRIQTRPMSMSQQSVTVYEHGNAIGFSEYLLQTSFFDQLAAASLLLGRDMALVLDTQLRDAVMGASSVVYPNGKLARTQLTSADRFNTEVIRDAVVALSMANSPKWAGDHYVCFIHPWQASYLRRDADWINAALYSGATQIYTGEIGRFEDVRFIETMVMPNGRSSALDANGDYADVGYNPLLANGTAGNTVTVFQAVMFGEYSYAHATALPVELRDNGVADFGREHGLAWYAIWGSGLLDQQNIVVIETA